MTCCELLDHMPDLVDGTVSPTAREAVDGHLAQCESCRLLVADLRRIRQAAAALEPRALPAGVWSRITAGLGEASGDSRRKPAPAGQGSWAWLAAAAVLVLGVSAGLWNVMRPSEGPSATTAGTAAPTGSASTDAAVDAIENELQLAAGHYENAIKGLEQIASESDSPLDPAVMATLKENLAVIDRAIDESRGALRTAPDSRVAQENLLDAFRRKIALLQDTIALMNEMRKGDEVGTARIVEGLNKS